jgi:outer membrane protein
MKALGRLVCLVCAAVAGAASAETLPEAWAAALGSHQLIAAASAERDAAFYELDGARSERRPSVGVSSGFTQLDTAPRFSFGGPFVSPPLFDNDNFVTAAAQVELPLFTGGAIRHGVEAARLGADASERQLESVTQNVKLAVGEAYVTVLRAESAVAVAESTVATLRAHAVDARNRYDTGAVPRNDFLAASVALANAEQTMLQTQNGLDLARAAYNRELGRELDATVVLDPDVPLDSASLPAQALEPLVAMALEQRDELAGFEAQVLALGEQSAAQRAATRPRLGLTGGYMYLENQVLDQKGFWMVGLGFEWNLFDTGRTKSRAAAIDSRASALAHQRGDLETLIRLQVRQAWLDHREAENRRAVAERAVEQAAENLEVARNRYRAGAGTNTEVLDAETLRTQSLSNLDSAQFDAAVALLRLQRAIGAI